MSREAAYQALFDQVKGIPGLKSASRRFRMWDAVDSGDKPALFLVAGNQTPTNSPSGEPATWRLEAEILLYVQVSDESTPPSSVLNPLLDALDARLRSPIPGRPQTLGGVVERAWISGPIDSSGDLMGDQAIASVPLEMLVTF